MKTEAELKLLLSKANNVINRWSKLKNPPDDMKLENSFYRIMVAEKNMLDWLLGDENFDFHGAYDGLNEYLDELESSD